MMIARIRKLHRVKSTGRSGKALIFVAIALPMLFGMLGLVLDGSMLMSNHRHLQTVTDAAAATAARELSQGGTLSSAQQKVDTLVEQHNDLAGATVTLNHPPASGLHAGDLNYVEAYVTRDCDTHFIQVLSIGSSRTIRTRAVAGLEPATTGAAVVVLDPDPSPVTITGLPLGVPSITLPPPYLGGLEVLGLGELHVDGAVMSNSEWGGVDENGDPAGESTGLRHAVRCMPILPLTKLRARDIWVTGGVDNPPNYGHFVAGKSSPLKAGKAPVPDPLADLPTPTLAADSANVSATERGAVSITNLPLLSPPVTLNPGVYEYINITSGTVIFNPGVYIIRNKSPITNLSLSIIAGKVTAEGVMFYITDAPGYSPAQGTPDANDGNAQPPAPGLPSMVPSVVLNAGLIESSFSGLNDPVSPFHGMLIYQRRWDRRPIVVAAEQLLGSAALSGTIYAKWGQLAFVGHGTYDLRLAAGTVRIVNALSCTFAPSELFPPAKEVSLIE